MEFSGFKFSKNKSNNKSIECFENAIRINPKNFSAFNNLGLSHKKLKNYFKESGLFIKIQ